MLSRPRANPCFSFAAPDNLRRREFDSHFISNFRRDAGNPGLADKLEKRLSAWRSAIEEEEKKEVGDIFILILPCISASFDTSPRVRAGHHEIIRFTHPTRMPCTLFAHMGTGAPGEAECEEECGMAAEVRSCRTGRKL